MPSFACQKCGRSFDVSEATLAKFPGWSPKSCLSCKNQSGGRGNSGGSRGSSGGGSSGRVPAARASRANYASREENLTVDEVLAKYTGGPKTGVFTDGAAEPNPGPGGWGTVYVLDDRVIDERCGHEPHTTNNRMELVSLIAGTKLIPPATSAVLYSDSQLCVSTINEWAKAWKARGWKRKGGEIKNLDLVQELYGIFVARPELELRWIAAHSGNRWNEYADALATAYRRTRR